MAALGQPLPARHGVGAPAGALAAATAAVLAMITTAGTLAARRDPYPGTAAERLLPLLLVLLCLVALTAGPVAAWAARAEHQSAAVGLAAGSVAVVLPLWAGWPWLPEQGRALLLAAAPLAVAGLAQVGLRWRPGAGGWALPVVWALTTIAAGVHALGYTPFADPRCDRTCADVPAVLDGILPTAATVTVTTALVVAAAVVTTVASAPPAAGTPLVVRVTVVAAVVMLLS